MEYIFDQDIWDVYDARKYWIVITTNIGWKRNGENVMGAGIAKQAANRFPWLPEQYGMICKEHKEETGVVFFEDVRLILLPTKRLNISQPHLSWMNKSDPEFIRKNLLELKSIINEDSKIKKVLMVLPGAKNGGLTIRQSLNIVKNILSGNPKIIMCDNRLR